MTATRRCQNTLIAAELARLDVWGRPASFFRRMRQPDMSAPVYTFGQYIHPITGSFVSGLVVKRADVCRLPNNTHLYGLAPIGRPWGAVVRAGRIRPEKKLPAGEFAPIWAYVRKGMETLQVFVLD